MAGLENIVEHLGSNMDLADTLGKIAHTHAIKGVKRYHIEVSKFFLIIFLYHIYFLSQTNSRFQKMLPTVLETLRSCRGGKQVDKKTAEAWRKLFDVVATIIDLYNEKQRKKWQQEIKANWMKKYLKPTARNSSIYLFTTIVHA